MNEYSEFGPGAVVLSAATSISRVLPKRGPGEKRGKNRKGDRKREDKTPTSLQAKQVTNNPSQEKGQVEGKGVEIDITI